MNNIKMLNMALFIESLPPRNILFLPANKYNVDLIEIIYPLSFLLPKIL
jgi:hypothetical protein